MFNAMISSVVDKLSGLNPIKKFLRYAIDKTLNQILNDQLTLQDFKNGCLNVTNIGFNVQKINKVHLVGSPYILHKGNIGNLKIILPPLSQISKKSIEIQVNEVEVQLKPNKNFYQNFKTAIRQIQQNDIFFVEEKLSQQQISENSPIDFFKQFLKQILLNIKIKVNNVVFKLFMNSPQKQKTKDQYYLMLRVPVINVNKNNQSYQKSIDKDQIKFNIQVPQFSIHLINDSTNYPQFENQKFNKNDFPFKYPNINHPSTILLFGLSDIQNIQQEKKKQIPKITFFMITDYKLKKKEFLIKSYVSNIQIMIDPIQFQIFSRFAAQIKQFKNILQYVKSQLNLKGQKLKTSLQPSFRKNKSNGKSHQDFFSSIIYNSITGDSSNEFIAQRISSGIRGSSKMSKNGEKFIDQMIKENKQLNQSVVQFNNEFKKQIQKQNKSKEISQQFTEEFRSFNFSTNFEFQIQLAQLHFYLLKCVPLESYKRYWIKSYNNKINEGIPIPYYMLVIRKLNYCLSQNGNNSQLSLTKLKIQNIKISKSNQKQSQEFQDLLSSTQFYKQNEQSFQSVSENHFKKDLLDFKLKSDQHFCIEQIVRISQKHAQNYSGDYIKKYNLLPRPSNNQCGQYILYKPGFKLHFNNKQQFLKIDIEQIALGLNFQVLKEAVQIIYPIFGLKNIEKNFSNMQQIQKIPNGMSSKKVNKSLFQSHYSINVDDLTMQNFIESNKKQLTIILNIQQINIGFYQVLNLNHYQDLVKKCNQKKKDSDNLSELCFCGIDKKQLYFQCLSVQIQKKADNLKLSVKKIVSGIVQLKNSIISNMQALIKIQSNLQETIKVFIEKSGQSKNETISIYIPDIQILLSQNNVLTILNIIKDQVIVAENIFQYFKYLKFQAQSVKRQNSNVQNKQTKKIQTFGQKSIQVFVKNVSLSFLQIQAFIGEVFVKIKQNQLVLKLNKLILANQQECQLFLAQMKNQELCLTQYLDQINNRRHKFVADKNIILQINNLEAQNEKFHSKNKTNFFNNKYKQKSSIQIKFYKQEMKVVSSNKNKQIKFGNSQKFKMIKYRQNISSQAPIQEQQSLPKVLSINFSQTLHLCAFNITRLISKKQKIEQFVNKIKQLTFQITLESKSFSVADRKLSNASDNESDQFDVKIGEGKITLDIRPQFKRKNKQIIFSNTRSFIKFNWHKIDLKFSNNFKNTQFDGTFDLKIYFLNHFDRQINLNPIVISQKQLQALGFVQIFQLNKLKFKINKVEEKIQFNMEVELIRCQMGTSTLGYLKIHVQHFLMHNIKKQYGVTLKQQQDQFCILQIDEKDNFQQQLENDLQIQDLTNAYQKYTQKMQTKKTDQDQFLKAEFIDPANQNCDINIKTIKISKIRIKIYSGSDFDFINVESLNESKQSKRNRQAQIADKYIELRLQNIYKCMKIAKNQGNFDINSFLKLQTLEINMSYNKTSEGFFKRLINSNKLSEQVMFPIIKNQNEIKMILKQNQKKTYIKFCNLKLDVGFRSDLLSFIQQIKLQSSKIVSSGWKKNYPMKKQIVDQIQKKEKFLLLLVPQTKLNLRLIYNGIQILSNQEINAQQFLLHQQINNQVRMQKVITKWIKNLLINNVGGLISGSAIKLFSKIIQQIFSVFKFLLGNLFGKSSSQD